MTWTLFVFVSGIRTELQARTKIMVYFDYVCFLFEDSCVGRVATFFYLLFCRTSGR